LGKKILQKPQSLRYAWLFRVTCCSQRFFEMCIKRFADGDRIVTRFTVQQSSPSENVDLRFAQLNSQATYATPLAIAKPAHPYGC
jgi:hypothetical protein